MVTELSHHHGITVSKQTVLRDLRALGFVSRVRPTVPTVAWRDEERRVSFAKQVLASGTRFGHIVFSDEKYFTTNDHTCRTQWVRRRGNLIRRERVRWPVKVHVWAAIGLKFRRVIVFPEFGVGRCAFRVGRDAYREMCLGCVIDEMRARGLVLQQDGAGAHNGAEEYVLDRGVSPLLGWPPRSPQLNPIENLWEVLQARVGKHVPLTRSTLIDAIVQEFNGFEESMMKTLVLSFKRRLERVIECNGKL
jgi:hypothetical protein